MNKCVIASDSFKGTLSSKEIADLFEIEFKKFFPSAHLEKVVLGDGGENTLEVFANAFPNGRYIECAVKGPNFQPIKSKYFVFDNSAVIELAEASGLTKTILNNPLKTTTFGVGELIKDAYLKGYRNFYITLGGSSTNDGGCGLLSALGVKFFNEQNEDFVPVGESLNNIINIDSSSLIAKDATFIILSDVNNPMFGFNGAAHIFARQKGATNDEIELLDNNLKYLNKLFIKISGKDVSKVPGSGAAGAASSGMLTFLNANILSGIETILDLINFDNIIKNSDFVFTGEGKLDNQSFDGKLISGVLNRTKKQNIKTICICGQNDLREIPNGTFFKVASTNCKGLTFDQIKKKASKLYSEAIAEVFKQL